jgi:class 3 adenylate cyclase
MFRDVRSMVDVIKTNWSIARRALCTLTYPSGPAELQRWHSDMMRNNLTPEVAARFLTLELEVDLTDVLPRVGVETLVVALRGQRGLGNATDVAALLSNARMTAFDGDNSLVFTDPVPVTEVIEGFLDEGRPLPQQAAPAAARGDVLTVLFTDITDSTALTQRLGDAEAQDLVRAHDLIVREALAAHGGSEIKHTGDGIMASFSTASGALECATAIQQAVAGRRDERLSVHIGVNAGEPVAEDGDIFGTAVQLARRVCDVAAGGEILASDVVRQLAAKASSPPPAATSLCAASRTRCACTKSGGGSRLRQLAGSQAAVAEDRVAGHVVGVLRGQEQRDIGDVLRFAKAAQRRLAIGLA